MSEITPNSYGLFDTPVRSPEKKRVTLRLTLNVSSTRARFL